MSVSHNYVNQAVVLQIGDKNLTKALVKEIQLEVEKAIDNKTKHVIWNLENCNEISNDVYDDLRKLVDSLKARNLQVVIFTNSKIFNEIEHNGYKETIPCYVSPRTEKTQPFDPNSELINLIIESLISTIKSLSEEEFKLEQMLVKQEEPVPHDAEVVGIIGMSSRSFKGSLILAFDKPVILSLASKILAENFTELTPEVAGWAGEILNMTMGKVKGNVNSRGENLVFTIPNCFVGSKMSLVENRSSTGEVFVGKINGNIGSFVIRFTQEELIK